MKQPANWPSFANEIISCLSFKRSDHAETEDESPTLAICFRQEDRNEATPCTMDQTVGSRLAQRPNGLRTDLMMPVPPRRFASHRLTGE